MNFWSQDFEPKWSKYWNQKIQTKSVGWISHPSTQSILEMVNCEGTNLIRLEPWLAGFSHVIQSDIRLQTDREVSSGWVGTCPFWVNWVSLNCQGKTIGHIKILWSNIFGLVWWFEFLGNIWLRLKFLVMFQSRSETNFRIFYPSKHPGKWTA